MIIETLKKIQLYVYKNHIVDMSCANGHLDIVTYLIESLNCKTDLQNTSGNTPLRIKILI